MAHTGQPAMPFGYDFDETMHQQDPRHRPVPSGPPLLTEYENSVMGNFFDNPDNSVIGMGNDYPFNFGFSELQPDLDWNFTPDVTPTVAHDPTHAFTQHHSPQALRSPMPSEHHFQTSRIDHSSMINGMTQPYGTSFDEGHMGANALLSMSSNSPGVQRSESRRSSDLSVPSALNPYAQHVLDAGRYTPTTPITTTSAAYLSNHTPIHAPSMASFHRASSTPGWSSTTRPVTMIPNELPFDTDQSFSHSTPNSRYNGQVGEHERIGRRGVHTANFSPFVDNHAASAPNHIPSNAMAPPARVNGNAVYQSAVPKSMTDIPTTVGQDNQVIKKMRTKSNSQVPVPPVEAKSSPTSHNVKGEANSSPRGSSESSPSGGRSTSPAPATTPAASKRRPQANATPSAAQSASGTKRQKLSEQQRKANHILSEKRRRAEMKQGYDQLDRLVPSLKSGGLSKAQVLQQTVVFLDALVEGNKLVEEEIARRMAPMAHGSRAAYHLIGAS